MNGMHGKYRSSPAGCVTGFISLFLIGVSLFFWFRVLTTPAEEFEEPPGIEGYTIITVIMVAGLVLAVYSIRRLGRNVHSGKTDQM